MAIHPGRQTDRRPASQIERLVRQRGVQKFGLFFVTGEGKELPNGDEDRSGFVIDASGQVYAFWTDWDPVQGAVVFSEWEPVEDDPSWHGTVEYMRARQHAGLARRVTPRAIRWTDRDGVTHMIPPHLIETAAVGLMMVAEATRDLVVDVATLVLKLLRR